jgi:hypothetical protein
MSFLYPALLLGLPLAGLPVVIHLINQRRFQNIDWGAMRFLLEANRMSRGFARIRQWLILLFRVLAVAALNFAISRPLLSGWLGIAAGDRADTTIVLVDRSASMQQAGAGGQSKLETGVRQLATTLGSLRSSHWVLIDSVSLEPQELETPSALVASARTGPASAAADLPALLQAAYDYIKANQAGRTEIWICSDLRANDWNAGSGKWKTLRDGYLDLEQGVRFHLLAYPQTANSDIAVRVSDVRRLRSADAASLVMTISLHRELGEDPVDLPVHIEVEGARSEVAVKLQGHDAVLKDHVIPLDQDRTRGWGNVSIPADANPANNQFHFAFAESPPRKTIIVADAGSATMPLELAAAITGVAEHDAEVLNLEPDQLSTAPWEDAALVIWQARLPTGAIAETIRGYIDAGGHALFLPPANPDDAELLGLRWTAWQEPADPVAVDTWRSDQDLLSRTQSGAALPVGDIVIQRYCGLTGERTPLATLHGGDTLLARATTPHGGAYFLTSTAAVKDSSLATNGIVLYAAVQRALSEGAARLSTARQATAGEKPADAHEWQKLAGGDVLSTEYPYQAGVYAAGKRTIAVNRSEAEDRALVVENAQLNSLFEGLSFDRVDDAAGSYAALTHEVWRVMLFSMIAALVAEAGLCLPKPPKSAEELR